MWRDVKNWVSGCLACQRRKPAQDMRQGYLKSIESGEVNNTVSIDILGPLTNSSRGMKYILIMVDHFSSWVEALPLRNIRAKTVADAFFQDWVCRFGATNALLSDRGSQFTSALLRQLCLRIGIDKIYNTAYHPQTNAKVERFNRFIAATLSLYTQPNQKDWDLQLPSCLLAYRSAVHASSNISPFEIMFGRDVKIPAEIV